jgi:hypothetical protein
MNSKIEKIQLNVLNALSGKIDDFYLSGGTALSLFHFQHRESDDLDFFSQQYNSRRVLEVIAFLVNKLSKPLDLVDSLNDEEKAKMAVYNLEYEKDKYLKIDFVEDVLELITPLKRHQNVNVLSVEDIFLRKLYAVSGLSVDVDDIGRPKFSGGRQSAKDLFDIYYISTNYKSLSDFIQQYCGQAIKTGVIRWFRTFKRPDMKMELSNIKTDKSIYFSDIDKHLKKEVDRIIEREIDL